MTPIQHDSWTPPPYDSFQSMEHIQPPYWDPYSSYSYPDQSPNHGYDYANSYDFSITQWAQQSSYPSISNEPNISEWQTYSNSMNPSTFDHTELEEQTMDPLERMNHIVQEFAKSRGLLSEDSPLDLTTHQYEPPFQTSMPDSLTYSSNNLDNQETYANHFNSFVNLIPNVVDDLSMGEPHIPMETNSLSTSFHTCLQYTPQGWTTFMILLSPFNPTNLSPHLNLIHILIS